MELRVFWTDTALFQLKEIFEYYKNQAGLEVARKVTQKIVNRTIQLERLPKSGQIEELLKNRKFEYRYLVEGKYKIIYWIEDNYSKIASVFDCQQNPRKIKKL